MSSVITAVQPRWAVPGGRVRLSGTLLPLGVDGPPHVLVGRHDARVVASSQTSLRFVVPAASEGGTTAVRIDELPGETAYLEVGRTLTTGVHQVDNPAFDGLGRLYVTQSGGRGSKVPVPLYRVGADGAREPLAVDIANPTSLAFGPDGHLYISSRFDGQVYRLTTDDRAELYAAELGVATGLAFSPDGTLFVGDRAGTIFKVTKERQVESFATLPASVAAFHLAFGPDGNLYVSAPTLASRDPLYRITPDRLVDVVCERFGRPQGLAFDKSGTLFVADALAGSSGLYKLDISRADAEPELVVAAPALIGVAFNPAGGMVLASNETIWALDL